MDAYEKWIAEYVAARKGLVQGWCGHATLEMQRAFPELIRQPGHVHGHKHWWCTTREGRIVDPTAAQFVDPQPEDYVPWPADEPIPTGCCPDCGEDVYGSSAFCDRSCESAFVLSLSL